MNGAFYRPVPLNRQAEFTLVNVFHECTEYVRNYTLPFNMLTIHLRAEGDDASVVENLRTGKVYRARMNDITLIPAGMPQQYRHTLRSERYSIHFRLELYPGIDVFSEGSSRIVENSPELRAEAEEIFHWRKYSRSFSFMEYPFLLKAFHFMTSGNLSGRRSARDRRGV